jgi:hypothetical protein
MPAHSSEGMRRSTRVVMPASSQNRSEHPNGSQACSGMSSSTAAGAPSDQEVIVQRS